MERRRLATILTEERLKDEYWTWDKSLADIAKEHDCTRQYIYRLLDYHGIPRRNKSQARRLAIKWRKLKFRSPSDEECVWSKDWKINRNFFKTWTPRMAYVFGFICADGCLDRQRPVFSISQKSPEMLEKIKTSMSCDKPLFKKKNGTRDIHLFNFYDKEIYDDLLKLGLTPNKSLTLKFPDMPTKCMRHFIRGCWDGDGSIFLSRGKPVASFVSGSKSFIKGVVRELYMVGIGRRRNELIPSAEMDIDDCLSEGLNIYVREGAHPSYSIKVCGVKCGRLFHYLYDGVGQSFYMRRKYEIFRLASSRGRLPLEI